MTYVACNSKLASVVRLSMHASIPRKETGWRSGVRSCIIPGLPMHLVQEVYVGTVLSRHTNPGNDSGVNRVIVHHTEDLVNSRYKS